MEFSDLLLDFMMKDCNGEFDSLKHYKLEATNLKAWNFLEANKKYKNAVYSSKQKAEEDIRLLEMSRCGRFIIKEI